MSTRGETQREARERAQADARHWMRGHVCRPGDTRAYHFATPGDSHYWFGLTWTPGHLTLVGDIGEITLTHYSALREFESGMRWAETSTYEYLIGKSNKSEQVLDRDATIERIWEMALEPAIEARRSQLGERRDNRRYEAVQRREWARDLAYWEANRSSSDEPPELQDYLGEPEPLLPLKCEKRFEYLGGVRVRSKDFRGRELWEPPDGWEMLHSIWFGVAWPYSDPNDIFTHEGRASLRDELESELDENAGTNEAAELCSKLGIDDYYGEYRYVHHTIAQIEAIRKGAAMILDELHPRRTWDRSWSDPVV